MNPVLVTGVAGFIGYHVGIRLLAEGRDVIGIDNLNDYYDVELKKERLRLLKVFPSFSFIRSDIKDREKVEAVFFNSAPKIVIHLAAQAGVRHSLTHPSIYVESNLIGFFNILEACRGHGIEHLVFASSSSVYGTNTKIPYSVDDNVDHPISLYAASKKANELMAHSYSHLFSLPVTGLRFFTIYGPWGRPDMAYYSFTQALYNTLPIEVYNFGNMKRDFTFIDDAVECIIRIINKVPESLPQLTDSEIHPGNSRAPYRLYNIGAQHPVGLLQFIEILESCTGLKAELQMLPNQPGDVYETFADPGTLFQDIGYKPNTTLEEGLAKFVEWYRVRYLGR